VTVWRVCVVGMDQFFGFRTNFCSFSKGLTCLYFSSGQIFFSHASKQTHRLFIFSHMQNWEFSQCKISICFTPIYIYYQRVHPPTTNSNNPWILNWIALVIGHLIGVLISMLQKLSLCCLLENMMLIFPLYIWMMMSHQVCNPTGTLGAVGQMRLKQAACFISKLAMPNI
jgi:hypothetical protein